MCTDKWKGCDSLGVSGYKHLRVDHSKIFVHGRVHINGLESFWSYAKQNLVKHHGMKVDKFPLYIKEMEWCFNNRNKN